MNVLLQSDRAHLLTDAAAYLPDGTLVAIVPKVRLMPHLSCAVAIRGAFSAAAIIFETISAGATTFDELREVMPDLMRRCHSAYAEILAQCEFGSDFEITVVGVDGEGKPAAYILPSHGRYGPPWLLTDLAGFVPLPCDQRLLGLVQARLGGKDPDAIDPEVDGLAVLELQRANPRHQDGDFCYIGGFAQLTTVTGNAVTSRIVHRWSDVVGQKIVNISP